MPDSYLGTSESLYTGRGGGSIVRLYLDRALIVVPAAGNQHVFSTHRWVTHTHKKTRKFDTLFQIIFRLFLWAPHCLE